MKNIAWIIAAIVFVSSLALGTHNASIYAPFHGFDGSGHVYYIKYLAEFKTIPPPTEWETHQPPLYYMIGALVMTLFGTFRAAHYVNVVVLWLIIGMVGIGLQKVLNDRIKTLLGMFALAALPMLNIFPAMITNELLSTFFIISSAVASLYLLYAKNKKQILLSSLWLGSSLILGVWTKISIITIFPTIAAATLIFLVRHKSRRLLVCLLALGIIALFVGAATPIFMRGAQSNGPSNVVQTVTQIKKAPRDLYFYYRLDWIQKVDMYNTQYYSLLGGAWNSFFSDGHNAITPFVAFHKKAFILWSLGFIFLPLSLYGFWIVWKKNKEASFVINTISMSMLAMYVLYNMMSFHYSAARLTYEMAIIVPYAFGIAASAVNKKMKILLFVLLSIQFITLLSFYWIQPWWHVTK